MHTLNNIIKQTKVKNKIIILDFCFAEAFGTQFNENVFSNISEISDNTTILAASKRNQVSVEFKGAGLFTTLFLDALFSGAANLLGNITPASIYSYVDKALGAWEQRRIFLTHSSRFISLKKVPAPIDITILRKIIDYFDNPEDEYKLDPTYEFTYKNAIPKHVEIFKNLQKYERNGLVIPLEEEHMYYSAIKSKACRLTAMGYQYWKLVKDNKI